MKQGKETLDNIRHHQTALTLDLARNEKEHDDKDKMIVVC